MATWRDISVQQAVAAKRLSGADVVRPSVSRAYYAVYSLITSRLTERGVRGFGRFGNPSHADLPKLVTNMLSDLSVGRRRELSKLVRRLRLAREIADYRPSLGLSETDRIDVIRGMILAVGMLGGLA